jgi:hypothetical protein
LSDFLQDVSVSIGIAVKRMKRSMFFFITL